GTVASVEKAGGRTLVPPVNVQDIARAAVVVDPEGAAIGVARRRLGDPPDEPAPLERNFFWNEYLARDPEAAVGFYSGLLGYQSEITDKIGTAEYHVFRRERPRGGLLQVPDQAIRPRWLSYILVSDPAALTSRVAALGGKVIMAPRADS